MTNYYFSQCYSMQYFWMFIFNVFIYDLKDYVLRLLASVAVLEVEPARVLVFHSFIVRCMMFLKFCFFNNKKRLNLRCPSSLPQSKI